MDSFTIIDGVVAAVIVISALLAFSRGLVRECLAIAGWVIAAIVAFIFAPQAEPLVKEIPYVNDLLSGSCVLSILVAFSLVFVVTLVVVAIFTPIFSAMIQKSALGPIDQGLGFLFGAARGFLLVVIAFILYDRVVPETSGIPMVENSRSKVIVEDTQATIEASIPAEAPEWIVARFEQLTGTCSGTEQDSIDQSGTSDT